MFKMNEMNVVLTKRKGQRLRCKESKVYLTKRKGIRGL